MTINNDRTHFSILFVDDEEQARKYFQKAYSKDFNILVAESVDEAKQVLDQRGEEIGVLITDQRMPGGNGVVLLNHVKDHYPHIVRLLTTAYSDLSDAIDAVNSGEILRYIVKPWDIKALHMELNYALRFFHIQNERDQLINEKLNVWQRMTELNHVRDLLVMAGSFSHLNHSIYGLRSLLQQTQNITGQLPDEQSLDLWKLLEQEVTNILSLAEEIKDATYVTDKQLVNIPLKNLLDQSGLGLSVMLTGESAELKGSPELLVQLLKSLSGIFGSHDDSQNLNLTVTESQNRQSVTLHFKPEVQASDNAFDINKDLIIVFLIAAHHGGKVTLNKENPVSMDFQLPLGTDNLLDLDHNDHWLEALFSLYEHQY